jgi:hypothetical protein
MVSFIRE